jgi:hypothetical protein
MGMNVCVRKITQSKSQRNKEEESTSTAYFELTGIISTAPRRGFLLLDDTAAAVMILWYGASFTILLYKFLYFLDEVTFIQIMVAVDRLFIYIFQKDEPCKCLTKSKKKINQ